MTLTGEAAPKGGDAGIHTVESFCCTAELTLSNKKFFNKWGERKQLCKVKVGTEIKISVCRMKENAGQNLNGYKSTVEDLCKRHPGQGISCGVKLVMLRLESIF